jgi:DNA-binding NarL/FixJ family response regulator
VNGPRARFRVLLIDDTVTLRGLLAQALESDSRFVVVGEAGDGRTGVAAAQELQPDAIVLDLAMPVMDGIEALPRLRAVAPAARIVVMSGFKRAPFAANLIRVGAVGYLEKGLPPVLFRRELLAVLGALDAIEPVVAAARTVLPASPPSARAARDFVSGILAGTSAGDRSDINLLVTELVTNAIVHARSEPQVVVQAYNSLLRVEVHDETSDLPVMRNPDDGRPGGRGLRILDRLASEWGVERRPGGKAVWFHYPLSVPATDGDNAV